MEYRDSHWVSQCVCVSVRVCCVLCLSIYQSVCLLVCLSGSLVAIYQPSPSVGQLSYATMTSIASVTFISHTYIFSFIVPYISPRLSSSPSFSLLLSFRISSFLYLFYPHSLFLIFNRSISGRIHSHWR